MKKLLVVIFAIAIGYGGYLFFIHESAERSDAKANPAKPLAEFADVAGEESQKGVAGPNDVPSESAVLSRDAQEIRDMHERFTDWGDRHGYAEYKNMYFKLSAAEIDSLIEAGDIGGMQHVAGLAMIGEPEKAMEMYTQAAIHGSTAALVQMADMWELHGQKKLKDAIPEELNSFMAPDELASIAYSYAAALRGDEMTAPGNLASMKGRLETLTSEERAAICGLSGRIVSELNQRRLNAGIPAFDNSKTPLFQGALSVSDVFVCD